MFEPEVTMQAVRDLKTVRSKEGRRAIESAFLTGFGEEDCLTSLLLIISDDSLRLTELGDDEEMDVEYLSASLSAMGARVSDLTHAISVGMTVFTDRSVPEDGLRWLHEKYMKIISSLEDRLGTDEDSEISSPVILVSCRRVEEHGSWIMGIRCTGTGFYTEGVRKMFFDKAAPPTIQEADTVENAVTKFQNFNMTTSFKGKSPFDLALAMGKLCSFEGEGTTWSGSTQGDSLVHECLSDLKLGDTYFLNIEKNLGTFFQTLSAGLTTRAGVKAWYKSQGIDIDDLTEDSNVEWFETRCIGNPVAVVPRQFLEVLFADMGVEVSDAAHWPLKVEAKCVPRHANNPKFWDVTATFSIDSISFKLTTAALMEVIRVKKEAA